jgi:hypothetical protein
VVTHPTTNLPTQWFNMAERTGSLAFIVLWSIAKVIARWLVKVVKILFINLVILKLNIMSWRFRHRLWESAFAHVIDQGTISKKLKFREVGITGWVVVSTFETPHEEFGRVSSIQSQSLRAICQRVLQDSGYTIAIYDTL